MTTSRRQRRGFSRVLSLLVPLAITLSSLGGAAIAIAEEPSPSPSATESQTPDPSPSPDPSPDPSPSPDPTTTPDPSPTADPSPTSEPSPTADPAPSSPADPILDPTIQSDKGDYAPGELVTLTGDGWLPGEDVQVVVNDDLGTTWRREVIVVADVAGHIVDVFNLPTHFVATYSVRATGQSSGLVAQTTFTDAIKSDYLHWLDAKSPPEWANTTIQQTNSAYSEGETVPHHFEITDLTEGQSYSIKIYFDYFDAGQNACGFSSFGTYNEDRAATAHGPAPAIDDPFGSAGSGSFYTAGVNVTGVTGFQTDPSKPKQRFIEVNFTALTEGDANTIIDAELYWGLVLSTPNSIGTCTGSRSWPGASLQTNVANGSTGVPVGGGGTLQINPNAILATTIDVEKEVRTDTDPFVDADSAPGLEVASGSSVDFRFTITNTGNQSLSSLTLTDSIFTFGSGECILPATLAPGATFSCTITRTVGSGQHTDTATATGTSSTATAQDTDAANVFGQAATIDVEKEVRTGANPFVDADTAPGLAVTPGTSVDFRFTITNTGNVTLSTITLTDSDFTFGTGECTLPATLAAGASFNCTISRTVGTGQHTDTATASGTRPGGGTVQDQDAANVFGQSPALTLDKTADVATYDSVGDVITYSYLVTNSGNVSLAGPVTIDDDIATDEACPDVDTVGNLDTSLDPGEMITCTASHTVDQADLNAGSVTNVATASAGGTTSPSDTVTVTAIQSPALTLDKTADVATYDSVGDVITYSYLVTNSGNVTIQGPIAVFDDKSSDESCPATAALAPGESVTCTSTHTITSADLAAASVTNVAYATGTFDGQTVTSNTDSETVTRVATETGAKTIGFWQNRNGQNIIKSYCSGTSGTSLRTYLLTFKPFQDMTGTSCNQIATYVTNVIKQANASGASMNAILKAQMLATALDVYFSSPSLGGNRIGAPSPIGSLVIDLTMICKNIGSCAGSYYNVSQAFGGAASMTVSQMLTYAANQSNVGGSMWYGNVKSIQEKAKDAFDAINNQVAFTL